MLIMFVEFIDELIDYPINRASLTYITLLDAGPFFLYAHLVLACASVFIIGTRAIVLHPNAFTLFNPM